APAGYAPPSFAPLESSAAGCFTILPQFGSAQVGAVDGAGAAVQLCVLSVEGPVQVPPLGSVKCPAPVELNIDDTEARVFAGAPCIASHPERAAAMHGEVARPPAPARAGSGRREHRPARAPRAQSAEDEARPADATGCDCRLDSDEETATCYRCKRKCHVRCYALGDEAMQLPLVCVTCQASADGGRASAYAVGRLLVARRAAALFCAQGEGRVFSVLGDIGCLRHRAQAAMAALQKLGVVRVDKSVYPHSFRVAPDGQRVACAALFGDDICVKLDAAARASQAGPRASAPRPEAD
ncbi:hypothetical protein H4R21_002375, partial [Coemansia helicoidea]